MDRESEIYFASVVMSTVSVCNRLAHIIGKFEYVIRASMALTEIQLNNV